MKGEFYYAIDDDGLLCTIPKKGLLCLHDDCESCDVQAQLLTCGDCGAQAVVTDCGCQIQPSTLSRGRFVSGQVVDMDDVFCEICSEQRKEER
jgi:hypothetical protein